MRTLSLFAPNFSKTDDLERIANLETHKLLERADLVSYVDSGLYTLLPLGARVVRKMRTLMQEVSDQRDIQEVDLPTLQKKEYWERSGRWDRFNPEIITIDSQSGKHICTPTNEEFISVLARRGLNSYRQLPLRFYQIGDIFKGNTSAKGVIRSHVFEVYEAYSFDTDQNGVIESRAVFESIFDDIFRRLELDISRLEYPSGDFVNYFLITPDGEHTLLEGPQGIEFFDSAKYGTSSHRKVKGLSIGMYKVYGDEFSRLFGMLYRDSANSIRFPHMSTYGIGLSRLLHAIVDQKRVGEKIIWPAGFAPFDFAIVTNDRNNPEQKIIAEQLYADMRRAGHSVLLDNRYQKSGFVKRKSLHLIGVPCIIGIQRGQKNDLFQIEDIKEDRTYQISRERLIEGTL